MSAITETEIKIKGMEALITALGEVQAEKFITLMIREPFDYTLWQRKLWNDKSVKEISDMAMKNRQAKEANR
jgi:hypothetical protein